MKNIKKLDGTFNIKVNGMPYNTIKGDKYFDTTLSLFQSNPELFEMETVKVKSLEELKAEKIAELKSKRDAYKKSNNYDNSNIVDNILIGLGNYTDEERLACKTFFNNLISRYNELKDLINNATLDTINSISITFGE